MSYYQTHREEVWCYALCIVLIVTAFIIHRIFF